MSYARKNQDSDVYVWSNGSEWICQECSLTKHDWIVLTRVDMLLHLAAHQAVEHKVPEGAIARLKMELADLQEE